MNTTSPFALRVARRIARGDIRDPRFLGCEVYADMLGADTTQRLSAPPVADVVREALPRGLRRRIAAENLSTLTAQVASVWRNAYLTEFVVLVASRYEELTTGPDAYEGLASTFDAARAELGA